MSFNGNLADLILDDTKDNECLYNSSYISITYKLSFPFTFSGIRFFLSLINVIASEAILFEILLFSFVAILFIMNSIFT